MFQTSNELGLQVSVLAAMHLPASFKIGNSFMMDNIGQIEYDRELKTGIPSKFPHKEIELGFFRLVVAHKFR